MKSERKKSPDPGVKPADMIAEKPEGQNEHGKSGEHSPGDECSAVNHGVRKLVPAVDREENKKRQDAQ